jgi:hypothetical protein
LLLAENWDSKPHNVAVESYLALHGKKVIQVQYNLCTLSSQIKVNTIAQSRKPARVEQTSQNYASSPTEASGARV